LTNLRPGGIIIKTMAKNTNKRIPIKWIRDGAKSAYEKQSHCWICQSTTDLELHHTHSLTLLLDRWCHSEGIQLETDEDVLRIRDRFISEHHCEIYEQVYTLCNQHHVRLHQVFGKAPGLLTAPKQQRWIELQRDKYSGGEAYRAPSAGSWFAEFTGR
jgi:5-methylcytosine-specific restriction endonuclease McrA